MGEKAATARTPAKTPSTAKKTSQAPSTGKQQSILGFFSKTPAVGASGPTPSPSARPASTTRDSSPQCLKETTKSNSMLVSRRTAAGTPVPSSDAIEPSSSQENRDASTVKVSSSALLVALLTLCRRSSTQKHSCTAVRLARFVPRSPTFFSLLTVQAKKVVSYAESSDEDDEEVFAALKARKTRQRRSRAVPDDDEEDTYEAEANNAEEDDDGNFPDAL